MNRKWTDEEIGIIKGVAFGLKYATIRRKPSQGTIIRQAIKVLNRAGYVRTENSVERKLRRLRYF